jgi:3-phosphoshikimate 1-carboxyvinyltransferase
MQNIPVSTAPVRSAWAGLQGVDLVRIAPLKTSINGTVRIPGSKSVTNRALIMAAAASGPSLITDILQSDDSYWCVDALRHLGVRIEETAAGLQIERQGPWMQSGEAFIGSGGTTGRFLTSVLACSATSPVTLTASAQLSARPMRPLFEALGALGCRFDYGASPFSFPVTILPPERRADSVEIAGGQSSQFLSGLLMGAPLLGRRIEIRLSDDMVSADYVRITLAMLAEFGIEIEAAPAFDRFVVHPGQYQGRQYTVEADASTASYFLALAAVTGGEITLENLRLETLQPDIQFVGLLERMGCQVSTSAKGLTLQGPAQLKGGFSIDMQGFSDTALTLAAIAPFADGPIEITNVEHMRHQECDRIAVMAASLAAVGVPVEERRDGLSITPAQPQMARLPTHDDHRIAMSLAVLGARGAGVELEDPGCVSKTCPRFFEMIAGLGVGVGFPQ